MTERHALVAGASGIVGRRIAEELARQGWRVTGLCRRPTNEARNYDLAALDLTDARACEAVLRPLGDVTHVFYAARYDHPEGVTESVDINSAMLQNLVNAIEPAAPRLRHIHLVHGTKYYAHMLGPVPVPLTEHLPRGRGTTFYFAHEDFIRERQRGKPWTYSISRPHSFVDPDPGEPRNLALLIAVYAAVARASGAPLVFPANDKSFHVRTQFTYVPFLARAAVWIANEPRCANEAFNVVNGDAPRWSELWPIFADYFGVKAGGAERIRLADFMRDKNGVWSSLVERHALQPTTLETMVVWPYADYVFKAEWDIVSSMSKARAAGFTESLDSARMFIDIFDAFRRDRVIP